MDGALARGYGGFSAPTSGAPGARAKPRLSDLRAVMASDPPPPAAHADGGHVQHANPAAVAAMLASGGGYTDLCAGSDAFAIGGIALAAFNFAKYRQGCSETLAFGGAIAVRT